jgi:transcriptional regulator with XRE-family HTH domain
MGILRVKELMQEKEISRDDLAEEVKVSKTTISNICTETHLPTIDLLMKIAEALDCDIRELFEPTKGTLIAETELSEAKSLINKGLNILKGKH